MWSLESGWLETQELDSGIQLVLQEIWPVREQILAFCKERHARSGFSSAVDILEERAVYELSSDSISKLAYLGASYGLDIFDHRDGQKWSQ
jgi:hypothetical protein